MTSLTLGALGILVGGPVAAVLVLCAVCSLAPGAVLCGQRHMRSGPAGRSTLRWRHASTAWLLLVCGIAGSQSQPSPPPSTISAPHELLSFFEGTWTTADSKPEDNFRETCAWLAHGRRHMVCRTHWQSPNGPREGFSVFSYDLPSGDYLYHGFRPGGGVVNQLGNPEGLGWQFNSTRGAGPTTVRTRVTIEPTAGGGFRLLEESSMGEGPWTVRAEVQYKRVAPEMRPATEHPP